MKHFIGKILCSVCISVLFVPGCAQNFTDSNDIIQRIDRRMAMLDSMIFKNQTTVEFPDFLEWSVDVNPDSAFYASIDAVTSAKIKALKAKTGLQLTGQTYYRPDSALGLDDEDDQAISRYTGKVQVEARWYPLQSGLLKKKGRKEEIKLQGDVERLTHERGRVTPDLYANRERLRTASDSLLASILLHRVDNLVLLEDAYMYLLDNENISSDNLLRILDDRAEAERRLSTISSTLVHASGLQSVDAGIIAIDTTALIASLNNTDLDLKIIDLKSKLIDKKADNTTWWSDVRLAPFVRYSHYFRPNIPSSANVDVGLSFTIPINAEASRQRKAMRAEKGQLDCERNDLISAATDKIGYLAQEVERLNRAIVGEWDRAASLRRYLKSRRVAYAKRDGEYNRLSALQEYNSYLRSLENIVEIQYRRDSLLADLQSLVPSTPLAFYCSYTPLTNNGQN